MHIVHIQHIAICIFCILCIFIMKKVLLQVFIVYCHYCLVPHPRAQLFTYHHLQPSPPFADLSQKAPGKSADSRRMAKGIVPVAPTGTRGRRPSMEDTGITYKTCACSRHTDPPRLRLINKSEYEEYVKYAQYDLVFAGPCTLPAQKHRRIRGTACQRLSWYGF